MEFSLLNIIPSVIILQLLSLVLFLLTSTKGKKSSNRILALFFLWLVFNLVDALLAFYGFYERYPQWAHLEDGFIFTVGPLLYWYTRSLIYKDYRFHWGQLLHLSPFLLFTASYQIYYHLQSSDYQKMIQSAITKQELPIGFYFFVVIIYLHIGTYLFISIREVNRYRMRIRNLFSSLGKVSLDWLMFMLGCICVILLVSVIYTFLPATGMRHFFQSSLLVPFIFILVFTNAVVWKGLKQPGIFSGIEFSAEKEEKKYAGSNLTEVEMKQVLQRLEGIVKTDKIFLQTDLTIDQLAEKVGTSPRKLSQIIHTSCQQNFFDFINSCRIDEAKRIMTCSTDLKLTVMEVMYQSGFNSKSSFNSIFRKKTGVTPSTFRKTALAGLKAV